ncbi:MAG: hypothetical protein ACI4JJ_03870 [Huintestinicola sp.]
MKKLMRKFLAAVMVITAVLLVGCGQYKKYDHLKTDIVGMWEPLNNAVQYNNAVNMEYRNYYEFTTDNKLVLHYLYDMGDVYDDGTVFEIKDNLFTVNGSSCILDIEDDTMTMTFNGGQNVFRRVSVEEATSLKLYFVESSVFSQQQDILLSEAAAEAEEESAAAEGETAAPSEESETTAADNSGAENSDAEDSAAE